MPEDCVLHLFKNSKYPLNDAIEHAERYIRRASWTMFHRVLLLALVFAFHLNCTAKLMGLLLLQQKKVLSPTPSFYKWTSLSPGSCGAAERNELAAEAILDSQPTVLPMAMLVVSW